MIERKPHKWSEVIKAWADGKPIQFRGDGIPEWMDYDTNALRNSQISALFYPFHVPRFDLDFEWRVKPEPIVVENYIWRDSAQNETRVSVSISPNVRFVYDSETNLLIDVELIR